MTASMMTFTEFESIENVATPRLEEYFPGVDPKGLTVAIQRIISDPRKFARLRIEVLKKNEDNLFGQYTAYFGKSMANEYGIYKLRFTNWESGDSPEFLFVSMPFDDTNNGSSYIICKTGDLHKILIKAKKNAKLDKPPKQPIVPILDESLFQTVYTSVFGFLDKRRELKKYNAEASRGMIFHGEPGNGKTTTVAYLEYLAEKNGYTVAKHSTSEVRGAMSRSLNDAFSLFTGADLIIFDDLDIKMFERDINAAANDLLTAMDGANKKHSSVRIFTTNEDLDKMDDAFLRPGRIDEVFSFPLPNYDLQVRYIETWHEDILKKVDATPDDVIAAFNKEVTFARLNGVKNQIALCLVNGTYCDLHRAVAVASSEDAALEKKIAKIGGFGG